MIGNNLILPNGICYFAKVNGFALEIVLFLITSGQPTATQLPSQLADEPTINVSGVPRAKTLTFFYEIIIQRQWKMIPDLPGPLPDYLLIESLVS